MRLSIVRKYFSTLAGGAAIVACIVAGSVYFGKRAVDAMVSTSAESRAQTFADFLRNDPARLNALLHGLTRDPETETRTRSIASLSHIVSFAIFDRTGTETFATRSDQNSWLLRDRPGGLGTGARLSEGVLEREGPWIAPLETGGEPSFLLPLLDAGGEPEAYLSVRIDMHPEHVGFAQTLAYVSVQLSGLLLLTMGVPALVHLRRKRKMKEADERIQFLHNFDTLTSLVNRRRMHEESERILATGRATRERMAVWFLDIDGLAEINDTLGQNRGDELLQIIAGRLKEEVESGDIVSRIGSDDFAILQRDVRGEESLRALAHRIAAAMTEPVELGGQEIRPRLTLGAALAPDHGRSFGELIKHAELAFLQQKSLRRGEYTLFQSWMDEEAHRRRTIEQLLRSALETDGFELFYQPILSGDGETLLGFEALLRMSDGEGGYISPAVFVPIAESRGYIKQIGTWVIREATRQIALWPEHLFVSVNLSAVQFRDRDLLDIVRSALANAGIDGRRLEIEVVESLLLDQSEDILDQLRALRALGISIDMDDFGTGYSSLGYLWRFPFDKLKIDQSFLHALRQGETSAAQIIETIISLAHHLGLKVTAEGIETQEQADLMRSFGCDQLQGYLFGKPRPASEVAVEVLTRATERRQPALDTERPGPRIPEHGLSVVA